MAVYIIDLENVGDIGLEGITQLTENDALVIGYSNAKHHIAGFYIDAIEYSGCSCKLIKLKRTGKNGLDFYLATEAGIQYNSGQKEIAIVSKDSGFQAVVDYFNSQYGKQIKIVKGDNILNCWNWFHPGNIKHHITDLDSYSLILQERNSIKKRIEDALLNTKYQSNANNIIAFAEAKRNTDKFRLYNKTTHAFGKDSGREIYNIIKKVI